MEVESPDIFFFFWSSKNICNPLPSPSNATQIAQFDKRMEKILGVWCKGVECIELSGWNPRGSRAIFFKIFEANYHSSSSCASCLAPILLKEHLWPFNLLVQWHKNRSIWLRDDESTGKCLMMSHSTLVGIEANASSN